MSKQSEPNSMNLFIDMDGTFVEYRYHHKINAKTNDFARKDFFQREILWYMVQKITRYIEELKIDWNNVYILTALPQNAFKSGLPVKQKIMHQAFPLIPSVNLLTPVWDNSNPGNLERIKVVYFENHFQRRLTTKDILIDDELPYLRRWEKNGGTALHISSLLKD